MTVHEFDIGSEDVGFKKIERYKAALSRRDVIRIVPSSVVEGGPTQLFWRNEYYTGKRANGFSWFTNKHSDASQNLAEQMGYEAQSQVVCLVIVLAWAPATQGQFSWDLRVMPWAFGNDKRKQFAKFKDMGIDLGKSEFLIRCTKEDFQELDITVLQPQAQMLPQLPVAHHPALNEAIAAGLAEFRKMVHPHSRVEQDRIINGDNRVPAGPAVGAAYGPQVGGGGFPTAPRVAAPAVSGSDPLAGLIGRPQVAQIGPQGTPVAAAVTAPGVASGPVLDVQGTVTRPQVAGGPVLADGLAVTPAGPPADPAAGLAPTTDVSSIVTKLMADSAS